MTMKPDWQKYYLLALLISMMFLIGCEPADVVPPLRRCPGKSAPAEALAQLKTNTAGIVEFKANGKCKAQYYDAKGNVRKEQFNVMAFVDPPDQIRFFGDIAFNARGLDVGANTDDFWFAAKPKELGNIYIWGQWSQRQRGSQILMSPQVLLEAFGLIFSEADIKWQLENKDEYDILTRLDEHGKTAEKIHIYNCNYTVSKIEYYDVNQQPIMSVAMADYQEFNEKNILPNEITIAHYKSDGKMDTFNIKLSSLKPLRKKNAKRYERPKSKGFKEIYKLIRGEAIKQQ